MSFCPREMLDVVDLSPCAAKCCCTQSFPVFELMLLLLTAVSSKVELWPCFSVPVHAKKRRFSATL